MHNHVGFRHSNGPHQDDYRYLGIASGPVLVDTSLRFTSLRGLSTRSKLETGANTNSGIHPCSKLHIC